MLLEGTVEESDLQPSAMCFVHEMDGYNLLLPETLVFMMPFLGWGAKTVSRETETIFKGVLEREIHRTAEGQGKKAMWVALSSFPGNDIILLIRLCGKQFFLVSYLFTHTCICTDARANTHTLNSVIEEDPSNIEGHCQSSIKFGFKTCFQLFSQLIEKRSQNNYNPGWN